MDCGRLLRLLAAKVMTAVSLKTSIIRDGQGSLLSWQIAVARAM